MIRHLNDFKDHASNSVPVPVSSALLKTSVPSVHASSSITICSRLVDAQRHEVPPLVGYKSFQSGGWRGALLGLNPPRSNGDVVCRFQDIFLTWRHWSPRNCGVVSSTRWNCKVLGTLFFFSSSFIQRIESFSMTLKRVLLTGFLGQAKLVPPRKRHGSNKSVRFDTILGRIVAPLCAIVLLLLYIPLLRFHEYIINIDDRIRLLIYP